MADVLKILLRDSRESRDPGASNRDPGSYVARPVVAPYEIGAELIEARAADLAHDQIDLVDKDVDRLFDARPAAGGGAIESRAPHKAEIGTQAQRDQYIGAAANSTIEKQGQFVADSGLNRRKNVEGARR